MPITLTPEQVAHDLAIRDLTDPSEGDHALQLLIDDARAALSARWSCEVRTARGPRIVSLADNYDRLRFPPAAVTRDSRYTRYVDDDHMLRSHSSAMIPPALRTLAGGHSDDTLVVCPGITYRRDAIDRQHLGVLREAELVVERRDGTRRLYRASPAQMDRLRQYLDEYWTASLQRLQFLAESAEREKGNTGG